MLITRWRGAATPHEEAVAAKTLWVDKRVADTPGFAGMTKEQKDKVIADAKAEYDALETKERQKWRESSVVKSRAKELGIDDFAEPAL